MAEEDKEIATVHERLRLVQAELKVPKTQEGRFGKHRNTEDILRALTPLLSTHGLTLTLDTEIINIGEKNYIKAIATVSTPSGKSIFVSSFAMEGEISRGLDAPQVTGAATSYARKYALGGLFAIDDGKGDPDAHKEAAPAEPKPKYATGPQKYELQKLMKAKGIDDAEQMTLFVESVIGKQRVETVIEYQQIKDALNEEVEDDVS